MIDRHSVPLDRDEFAATFVELTIRLAALAALLYFTFTLIYPFSSIVVWSAILAAALYPAFDWISRRLGGRRRLAAILITILTLLIVIGPAVWLARDLFNLFQTLSQFNWTSISLPSPVESVRRWPLIGDWLYQFWYRASTNLSDALILPPPAESVKHWPLIGDWVYQYWYHASTSLSDDLAKAIPKALQALGASLFRNAAGTGTETLKFLGAIIVAAYLLPFGPSIGRGAKNFSRHLVARRGEEFVNLAGVTIRTISLGVIGISAMQALLVGIGLIVARVQGTSLITSAVLICGIIQIGPSVVLIPLIIWSWTAMELMPAVLFTAYMIFVHLLSSVLKPVVMRRGLRTPMPITFVGVFGGALAYGISGLFLGPIVLAVSWELLAAWTDDSGAGPAAVTSP
jgi:predicted PurR-regulated permease PerM